jgi:hypothetical protein
VLQLRQILFAEQVRQPVIRLLHKVHRLPVKVNELFKQLVHIVDDVHVLHPLINVEQLKQIELFIA